MPLTSACCETFLDGAVAPASSAFSSRPFRRRFLFQLLAECDQPFGGIGPAIQQNVFDQLEQLLRISS